MGDTPTDRETVERLEQVPHWDGDACACAWCGESEAAVCIASEPVCATCHTIAYERALIRDRRALRLRAEVAITLRDDAVRERNEMRARAEAAEAEVERLREVARWFVQYAEGAPVHRGEADEMLAKARAALGEGGD